MSIRMTDVSLQSWRFFTHFKSEKLLRCSVHRSDNNVVPLMLLSTCCCSVDLLLTCCCSVDLLLFCWLSVDLLLFCWLVVDLLLFCWLVVVLLTCCCSVDLLLTCCCSVDLLFCWLFVDLLLFCWRSVDVLLTCCWPVVLLTCCCWSIAAQKVYRARDVDNSGTMSSTEMRTAVEEAGNSCLIGLWLWSPDLWPATALCVQGSVWTALSIRSWWLDTVNRTSPLTLITLWVVWCVWRPCLVSSNMPSSVLQVRPLRSDRSSPCCPLSTDMFNTMDKDGSGTVELNVTEVQSFKCKNTRVAEWRNEWGAEWRNEWGDCHVISWGRLEFGLWSY